MTDANRGVLSVWTDLEHVPAGSVQQGSLSMTRKAIIVMLTLGAVRTAVLGSRATGELRG
ncbi:MAG: hypothetical protein JSU86_01895 [Phycisphaerales bacterium]|nr:MAG: hypothetical protein JSU86_01895 [Phycisphaerales bacterium]